MEKGIINKGEKMKKKRRLKKWVLVVIGFMLGVIYSNLFIYSDLIKSAEASENVALVQTYSEEENEPQKQNKVEITKEYECTLDEVSCKIKKVAQDYGVDWRLAIAISIHESGNYTSYIFKYQNNVGGMWNGAKGEFYSYDTLEDGIDAYISNLKYNYIDVGLTTIEEIGNVYCPVGINDNGDNKYWIPKVTKYYKELGGE